MKEKEEYLSITDMSKLRGVTTETLRHYDRIGLLTPDFVNEYKVRYYSVLKYEKLGTIKELKQLGMSLSEIKGYFENRNCQSSMALLEKQKEYIQNQMKTLKKLQEKINGKIHLLHAVESNVKIDEVYIRHLPKRYYIASEKKVSNEIELSYEAMRLEQKIYKKEEYVPIYATTRYGGIFSLQDSHEKSVQLIIFTESENDISDTKVLPEGEYLCVQSRGPFWEREKSLQLLYQSIEENHYEIVRSIVIENVLIDYTITDMEEERLFEYQILI